MSDPSDGLPQPGQPWADTPDADECDCVECARERRRPRDELVHVSTEILKAILTRQQGSGGLGYPIPMGEGLATHVCQAVNAATLLIADVDSRLQGDE